MTTRRTVAAILDKAPADALAGLSTSSFMRGDTAELNRIFAALPAHGISSRREFLIKHHALTEAVLMWCIEYLKTVANARACLVAALASDGQMVTESMFLADAHNAKAASLVEALRIICANSGIDFEDVCEFAEVEITSDARPIPGLVNEYVETFGVMA